MSKIKNLEDCVSFIVDKSLKKEIDLEKADHSFFYSVDRQLSKKIPFTERQKLLVIKKITNNYLHVLPSNENIEQILQTTKYPLRVIKYTNEIKVLNKEKSNDEYPDFITPRLAQKNSSVISVEFPFNRKYLNKVLSIRNEIMAHDLFYFKPGRGRIHYFQYAPLVIRRLVENFGDTKMKIDEKILDSYEQQIKILDSRNQYISKIDENGKFILSEYDRKKNADLKETDLIMADRHRQYGISVDNFYEPKTLLERIAYRSEFYVLANPEKISVKQIMETLNTLSRFPIIVVLESSKSYEQLKEFYEVSLEYVPNNLQSVLVRSDTDREFNNYIRENYINNMVDSNTKIVYINEYTLPKILLKTDWKPSTTFQYCSFMKTSLNTYINMSTDLRICYEKELSPFRKSQIKYDEL